MRIKTSITLPEDLLNAVDQLSEQYGNRSELIEAAVRAFVTQKIRDEQNARDLRIINERADYLNEEALDVLSYQAVP